MTLTSLAIVIPVFNEIGRLNKFLAVLGHYLEGNRANFFNRYEKLHLVIVDDGSADFTTSSQLPRWSSGWPSIVNVRHPINLGQGAALQTGVEFALNILKCDLFVTMDADGQHQPEDLRILLDALENSAVDIVFGTRFHGSGVPLEMPRSRRLILKLALVFERYLTGLNLSDAHNGFRAFNAKCARRLDLKQNRMAHATEFKQIVANCKIKYTEAPVRILYSEDTIAKGQRNLDGLKILKDLLTVYLFQS